jgi:hypothetical protein
VHLWLKILLLPPLLPATPSTGWLLPWVTINENWIMSELEQSSRPEAIGQLTGGIAHDLNNLLQANHGQSRVGGRGDGRQLSASISSRALHSSNSRSSARASNRTARSARARESTSVLAVVAIRRNSEALA